MPLPPAKGQNRTKQKKIYEMISKYPPNNQVYIIINNASIGRVLIIPRFDE